MLHLSWSNRGKCMQLGRWFLTDYTSHVNFFSSLPVPIHGITSAFAHFLKGKIIRIHSFSALTAALTGI